MTDKEITGLFLSRSENAIIETERKYGKYIKYIANSILSDARDVLDAENDTYMHIWLSIPPQCPESLKGYIAKTVRNISINMVRFKERKRRCAYEVSLDELAECIGSRERSVDESLSLSDALERFLRSLDEEERITFIRRYWYFSEIKDIARDRSIGRSAVKMRLLRTREKLKNFLAKEGFDL